MPPVSPARVGQHGRYVIGDEFASGGMATVHLGRMLGDAGFARTVAIKRLHPQLAKDPEVAAMLIDEGRLAARIHHLNVVTTIDVVASGDELFVVMEYVHGEPLSALIRAAIKQAQKVPPRVVSAVLSGALRGLHAAHEARDERGEPLNLVHRDVSPQNILVGSDGVARVLDFGVAKAAGRAHVTQDGRIKGKFGYMPPEQLHGEVLDRRADVYAAGVVLWEALVGARLFAGKSQMPDFAQLLEPEIDPPSARATSVPRSYDAVVMRALARSSVDRFPTTLAMAEALEASGPVAPPSEVGTWVVDIAGEMLAERAERITAIEARLLKGVRESMHLIEAADLLITHLDRVPTTLTPTTPRLPIPREPESLPEPITRVDHTPPAVTDPTPAPVPEPEPELPPEPVTGWNEPAHGRSSVVMWTGAALLGAMAIAATFAVIASVPGTPQPAPAPAESESAAPPASASPSAEAPPPPPEPTEAPVVTATASATAEPPAPSAKAAPKTHPPPHRPAADGCSPPFTIDAAGHKHYKRECLH